MRHLAYLLAAAGVISGCATPPHVITPQPALRAPASRAESPYVGALHARVGKNAELTLSPTLQVTVEQSLLDFATAGAVVALDPNNGAVRALFSVPGDRGDPLTTPQHPASTFKSFVAVAALQLGVIDVDTTFTCNGKYDFSGMQLTCPFEHGNENVGRALAVSCNAFFYDVATKLSPSALSEVARTFGLASRTGIELPDLPGVIPDPTVRDPRRLALPLTNAIGHGDYLVTLLGLARAYAAIANGGNLFDLHVVRGRYDANGRLVDVPRAIPPKLEVDAAALAVVRAGLTDAVAADYGRSHRFAIDGYLFAGKTGGADSPPRSPPQPAPLEAEIDSWFVAYAPPVNPTLLVAARVERVTGDKSAAQLVARVLSTLKP